MNWKIYVHLVRRTLDPWQGLLDKTLTRRHEFYHSLWRRQVSPVHKWNPRSNENKLCSTFQWYNTQYLIKFIVSFRSITNLFNWFQDFGITALGKRKTRPVLDRFHDSSKYVLVFSIWFAQICLRYPQLNTKSLPKAKKVWPSVPKAEKVWQSVSEVEKVCQKLRKYGKVCQKLIKCAKAE